MKGIDIPPFLHEVFGVRQKVVHIVVILLFGATLSTVLLMLYPKLYMDLALWKRVLTFLLVFDIGSGCIANFTQSTSDYYATRKSKRIVFLTVHVHLILVALLLQSHLVPALLVWMYTIVCASIIQAIKGRNQVFIVGVLLSLGIAWIPLLEMGTFMLIVSMLFMVKVLFSFSVDHYRAQNSLLKKEGN
jgi:hypothetical protein